MVKMSLDNENWQEDYENYVKTILSYSDYLTRIGLDNEIYSDIIKYFKTRGKKDWDINSILLHILNNKKREVGVNVGKYDRNLLRNLVFLTLFDFDNFRNYLEDIDFKSLIRFLTNVVPKKVLFMSDYEYPKGGGEAYIFNEAKFLISMGIEVYWVSFKNYLGEQLDENSQEIKDGIHYIKVNYSADLNKMKKLFIDIDPSVAHIIGSRKQFYQMILNSINVKCIVGFHFWDELITLDRGSNTKILDNIKNHKFSNQINLESQNQYYVVSEFMMKVVSQLNSKAILDLNYPIHPFENIESNKKIENKKFTIAILTSEELKGFGFFQEIAKVNKNPNFEFVAYGVPYGKEDKNIKLLGYKPLAHIFKEVDLVLAPSIVDETFGRVAYECAITGIPIIASNVDGYTEILGNESTLELELGKWVNQINMIVHDVVFKKKLIASNKHKSTIIKGKTEEQLSTRVKFYHTTFKENVMIFSTVANQGLGNLSRQYNKIFHLLGKNTYIFAYQSYFDRKRNLFPEECSEIKAHYSLNNREAVTIHELSEFIILNYIKILIIPELCFYDNWKKIFDLKRLFPFIRVVLIPMPEIVRKDEIHLHEFLDMILCPNEMSYKLFTERNFKNIKFLGHADDSFIISDVFETKIKDLEMKKKINFLHIAGHNPITRKNTKRIIEVFINALNYRKDIHLTITTQTRREILWESDLPENVRIIDKNLNETELQDLFNHNDLTIQLPFHEGIGLGFLESMKNGLPVITMNVPPNNEFILDKSVGYFVNEEAISNVDNFQGVFNSWQFDRQDFLKKLLEIEIDSIIQKMLNIQKIYNKKFSVNVVKNRLFTIFHMDISLGKPLKELKISNLGLILSILNHKKRSFEFRYELECKFQYIKRRIFLLLKIT
jgi:glycosyltransferase involved in cell wall biosynthesis